MGRIGAMRSQREFQVAGELELPAAQRAVRNGQAAYLGVVVGGHRHIQDGLNAEADAA